MSSSHSLFSTCCSAQLPPEQDVLRVPVKTAEHIGAKVSLICLVSTSRTFGSSCSPGCPVSPWLPPPDFSEMVHRSFLECLLDWCLLDHLWGAKIKASHVQKNIYNLNSTGIKWESMQDFNFSLKLGFHSLNNYFSHFSYEQLSSTP